MGCARLAGRPAPLPLGAVGPASRTLPLAAALPPPCRRLPICLLLICLLTALRLLLIFQVSLPWEPSIGIRRICIPILFLCPRLPLPPPLRRPAAGGTPAAAATATTAGRVVSFFQSLL